MAYLTSRKERLLMLHLEQSLTIHGMTLHNRLVMPPMATEGSTPDGSTSEKTVAYYEEKAADRALGLIITEHSFILPQGKASPRQSGLDSDSKIEGYRRLTDAIHKYGTKVAAQISHAGGRTVTRVTGETVVAPSVEAVREAEEPWRAMTWEDICAVVDAFAQAARRAREAGFDAVEIHSAHGYLLNQFYSPYFNHRTDAYGGGLENRIRIHLEVIRAVRRAVGGDFPVSLRLGACDYMEGGATIQDAVTACAAFEKAGIDLLDISGGVQGYMVKGREGIQGYFSPESFAIKQAVHIPVILTGGITEPAAAEQLLADGAADLIGVGRAILKDSHWGKKAFDSLHGNQN